MVHLVGGLLVRVVSTPRSLHAWVRATVLGSAIHLLRVLYEKWRERSQLDERERLEKSDHQAYVVHLLSGIHMTLLRDLSVSRPRGGAIARRPTRSSTVGSVSSGERSTLLHSRRSLWHLAAVRRRSRRGCGVVGIRRAEVGVLVGSTLLHGVEVVVPSRSLGQP